MKDTRRKIPVTLEFYEQLQQLAKKEKRTLAGQLRLMLEAYTQIVPRQKDIEKRVVRLEKKVLPS